jgi:hypothetical protein
VQGDETNQRDMSAALGVASDGTSRAPRLATFVSHSSRERPGDVKK